MTVNYGDLECSPYMIGKQEAAYDRDYVECSECGEAFEPFELTEGFCSDCHQSDDEHQTYMRGED